MIVNDNAGYLDARGVWSTIASMLAPTEIEVVPVGAGFLHAVGELGIVGPQAFVEAVHGLGVSNQ